MVQPFAENKAREAEQQIPRTPSRAPANQGNNKTARDFARNDNCGPISGVSGVAEEGFETVIHVLLDVAVEEGEAGLVGGEVYGGAAVIGDDYGVLDDA